MAFGHHATNIRTKNYVVKLFKWSNVPKQNSSNYGFIEHQEAFQIIPNYFLFHFHLRYRDLPVAVFIILVLHTANSSFWSVLNQMLPTELYGGNLCPMKNFSGKYHRDRLPTRHRMPQSRFTNWLIWGKKTQKTQLVNM